MNGLDAIKPWYTRRLRRLVDLAVARRISPDVFTQGGSLGLVGRRRGRGRGGVRRAGLVARGAGRAGRRLAGANVDGAVARARGVSGPWGFVLNELGDGASDLIVFGGLAWLAAATGGPVALVATAAVAATLPTFASLAAAGAGATRRNGGPVGKTERCALVVVATAGPARCRSCAASPWSGSVATAVVRLLAAHRELSA